MKCVGFSGAQVPARSAFGFSVSLPPSFARFAAAGVGLISALAGVRGNTMSVAVNSLACERWIAIAQADAPERSGDCAQVVSRWDGRALFFVGDVAGHDARAALLARQIDARVCDLAGRTGPGALLTALNGAVAASWPPDLFVSAVCFSLDPVTGAGTIAVAGQLPPIVKGLLSSAPVDVQGGPPLGVVAAHVYVERGIDLAAHELLVAVTDGVTDPLATRQDLLGLSALAQIVDHAPPDPTGVCAALLRAARRAGLHDNATVVAAAPPH
jgi:serine phosphatase RsbU (regulator of sigma subunit)